MINKRKLDELIKRATYAPEELCAYTFEEYCSAPWRQKHVCNLVNDFCIPRPLTEYLHEDCYYEDIETVEANLNYVNSVMKNKHFYKKWWVDITPEAILEEFEQQKEDAAKRASMPAEEGYSEEEQLLSLEQAMENIEPDDFSDLFSD